MTVFQLNDLMSSVWSAHHGGWSCLRDMSRCQSPSLGYTQTRKETHTKNHCPIEPVCQSRYLLISVSSNGKTDLQSVEAAQVLIYGVLALLNIQTMEKSEEKKG